MKVNFCKCMKTNDMLNYELKNNSERKFSLQIQNVIRLNDYSHGVLNEIMRYFQPTRL